ncbi:MAG TPA: gliding motility lipoprotein GldD [Bacteroidales bacterium]|nr:gliding motility lipoprotein GldD [Bacteroidales bacterium]HBZ66156.1 gliding motility lipoprotein GldD [Bacteroidales bacterium]
MKIKSLSLFWLSGTLTLWIASVLLLSGCSETPTPRPRAYIRIDLPEKNYTMFDSTFPYRFDYPVYSQIQPDTSKTALPYWLNIEFGKLKATLFLSYKPIKGDELATYLEDNHLFLSRHIPKASGIEEMVVENKASRVFGMIYNVTGTGAASPVQFYLTDSINHFVRGALYFNFRPNNDSLRPVIDFLNEDIIHLAETFRWK